MTERSRTTTPQLAGCKHWRLEWRDEIAQVVLDTVGAAGNTLPSEAVRELDTILDLLERHQPPGVILASGNPAHFVLGADINEFTQFEDSSRALEMVRNAHRVFDRLENMTMPVVAMINGHALGGGMELALACTYRVCVDDAETRLGLPEILLGIHPGYGGTARLIEKIGALPAMNLMLAGRTLNPARAGSCGMVDTVVPRRHLERAALLLLRQKPAPRRAALPVRLANAAPLRRLLARVMRRKVAARAPRRHYPAPYALIDLWEKYGGSKRAMLTAEAESVAQLITTNTARNLVRVFLLREKMRALGKSRKARGGAAPEASFERVHVVGAGIMGGDIAAWCALRGLHVTVEDADSAALTRATARACKLFRGKLRKDNLVTAAMDRFAPDLAGDGARRADLIIEAIYENADAKKELFQSLEQRARPEALLATNTSSIPLETLDASLQQPGRLVGLHFFNPVARMQLVEIVRGKHSDEHNLERAAMFTRRINRLPLPVKSAPGFLVNRILMPYLREAVELLQEGVSMGAIDKAATGFGMPMGPIELADTVGLDICASVMQNLGAEAPPILNGKVNAGHLGRKTGRGFYMWKHGKPYRGGRLHSGRSRNVADRMMLCFLNEAVAWRV